MLHNTKVLAASLGAALVLVGLPAAASGQQRFEVEGRAGVAIPAGPLADIQDIGPSFGAKLAYRIHPRIALRVDGDVELLNGADLDNGGVAPDLSLYHYNGGIDVQILEPGATRWSIIANAGAGATTIDSDDFSLSGGSDFTQTYFSANGGLLVGYDVNNTVRLFVSGQAYVVFADEDDTAAFAALSPEVDSFGTFVSFPLTGGITLMLN